MLDLEPYKRRVEAAGKDHAPALSVACGRELIAEIERLRENAWTIEMIVGGFNKIAVEERDEMKRENRRLQAENKQLREEIEQK